MSTEYITELMEEFDADKFLNTDAWVSSNSLDLSLSNMEQCDDLPSFLDRELESMDLSMALKSGLEVPMLSDAGTLLSLDPSDGALCCDDAFLARSDSDSGLSSSDYSSSGYRGLQVKNEPLSPASSFSSEHSSDSSNHIITQMPLLPIDRTRDYIDLFDDTEIKIESPPLTPLHDSAEPRDSFLTNQNQLTSIVVNGHKKLTNHVTIHKSDDITKTGLLDFGGKVKIIPKPLMNSIKLANKSNSDGAQKPIVLSAEEFQRLASTGLLRFQQPAKNTEVVSAVSNLVPNASSAAKPAPTNCLPPVVSMKEEIDLRSWKRQQRMIKNRESACLSRKRKKEQMQCLEDRLNQCIEENDRLKEENSSLKRRLNILQSENDRYRKSFSGKAACVLAVLFLFSFNLGSLSPLWRTQQIKTTDLHKAVIHGSSRHLLSLSDSVLTPGEETLNASIREKDFERKVKNLRASMDALNSTQQNDFLLKSLEALSVFNSCPSYFNKTESLRLADALTGWVLGHKASTKVKPEENAKPLPRVPKKYRSLNLVKPVETTNTNVPHSTQQQTYQVQLFRNADKSFIDFFDAIQRRNDTFYVVSFRQDHLLLPATAHNKTMRPRMSLVMPAVSLNDSLKPPRDSLAMMQIDCEVMDTRLIHVIESAIPNSSRDENVTSRSSEDVNAQRKEPLRFEPAEDVR